jgi:hypothetical protein
VQAEGYARSSGLAASAGVVCPATVDSLRAAHVPGRPCGVTCARGPPPGPWQSAQSAPRWCGGWRMVVAPLTAAAREPGGSERLDAMECVQWPRELATAGGQAGAGCTSPLLLKCSGRARPPGRKRQGGPALESVSCRAARPHGRRRPAPGSGVVGAHDRAPCAPRSSGGVAGQGVVRQWMKKQLFLQMLVFSSLERIASGASGEFATRAGKDSRVVSHTRR